MFDDIAVSGTVLSLSSAANAVGLGAWLVPAPGSSALRLPVCNGPAQVQLLDNLGRVVWQRQLAQNGVLWEGTVLLPATTGLYSLSYQPKGAAPGAWRCSETRTKY
ncbi:MAG: hypothetical protein EOO59_09410 [Hymenobacter sp.]|nr:MAG: hypothetical protein EOO59_09410 [Hymenobacter sp.]